MVSNMRSGRTREAQKTRRESTGCRGADAIFANDMYGRCRGRDDMIGTSERNQKEVQGNYDPQL